MIFILVIIGLLIVILSLGKVSLSIQFTKKVKELFSLSESISNKIFHKEQILDLPEPVKKYFSYSLKDGQPYIIYVRIRHIGQFKTGIDKGWINIKGEQYATTEKPGFIWKGTTSMFTAQDMYIDGKGKLKVSLFNLINIVNAKGDQYNQGELLRWLGESILYPTNFLPSDNLQWFPIDATTARFTYSYKGLSLMFKVRFNEIGEITEMETKRYMDVKSLETWVIKVYHYKELNEVVIPTSLEVLWRLEKGDFEYARFLITEIEYDLPEKY